MTRKSQRLHNTARIEGKGGEDDELDMTQPPNGVLLDVINKGTAPRLGAKHERSTSKRSGRSKTFQKCKRIRIGRR